MNPWGLDATDLLVWGIILHLVGDWLLQNEWMALNKARRRNRRGLLRGGVPVPGSWWDRHPSAYVHAAIHGAVQLAILGPIGAVVVVVTHFLIDLRAPVAWWSRLIRQTQPAHDHYISADAANPRSRPYKIDFDRTGGKVDFDYGVTGTEPAPNPSATVALLRADLARLRGDLAEWTAPAYDIGTDVRIWADQTWHLAVLALVALAVG